MAAGAHSAAGIAVRVGVTLTGGLAREHLDAFCAALAASIGAPVTPVGVWYYHRLLEALDLGHVDLAWLPPILAAQATSRGTARPLAIPLRGGVSSYSTALFTRDGSPLRTVSDLSGHRVAWVDRQSASGYLLIRAHLRALGVDLERAFAADRFTGSHEEVAHAVLDGAADVGASFVHLDPTDDTPVRAAWGPARVRILTHAGPIPADLIAVSTRLDPALAKQLERVFVEGRRTAFREATRSLLGAEGFVLPRPGHLDAVTGLLPQLDEHAVAKGKALPR